MLRDYITFGTAWATINQRKVKAVTVFIKFLEKKFGARFLYDKSLFIHGRSDLATLQNLSEKLKQSGVIRSLSKNHPLVDEPAVKMWSVECDTDHNTIAGGISFDNDHDALIAALAEGVERYLWVATSDWCSPVATATVADIKSRGEVVSPRSFLNFTDQTPLVAEDPNTEYRWVKGRSLVSGRAVWLPAQVISPVHHREIKGIRSEPILRELVSNGLATGQTRTDAELGGLLEVLERDAFMITWLNQISPPRLPLSHFTERDPIFRELVNKCDQYMLKVHLVKLLTDAPTQTVMAVIEDTTSNAPRFSFGMSAGADLFRCARHSILEALRNRHNLRLEIHKGGIEKIKNARQRYWNKTDDQAGLEFLVSGPFEETTGQKWDSDTKTEHLERLLNWCRRQQYECVAFDVGASRSNPTDWKVSFVSVPSLMPMNISPHFQYSDGARLRTVPLTLGYEPLPTAWRETPHPFL